MSAALILHAAEAVAVILIAANLVIWGSIVLRRLGIKPVRLTAHPGRHASTERVYAGGRYLGTQPRADALPLTEQEIEVTQTPDSPPWDRVTGANPVLNDDAETLFLYQRGEHGTKPQLAIEGARTATGELRALTDQFITRIGTEGDAYRRELSA